MKALTVTQRVSGRAGMQPGSVLFQVQCPCWKSRAVSHPGEVELSRGDEGKKKEPCPQPEPDPFHHLSPLRLHGHRLCWGHEVREYANKSPTFITFSYTQPFPLGPSPGPERRYLPQHPGYVSQRPQGVPTALGLPEPLPPRLRQCPSRPLRVTHPDLPPFLPPSVLHFLDPAPKQQASGPHWCVNRAPGLGQVRPRMSPQGHLRPSLSQKVLVKPGRHSCQTRPLLAPISTNITGSSKGLGCFPSTWDSEPRGLVSPLKSGPCFPEGTWSVSISSVAPENMGFSPWVGKWWNRLERTRLGPNLGPPSTPEVQEMSSSLSGPQFPQIPAL